MVNKEARTRTTVYEMQLQGGLRFTDESQFTHGIHDRDHDAQIDRSHEDMIAYKQQAPQNHLGYYAAADDLVHGTKSMDVSSSSSYSRSSYPNLHTTYYPYGYGYAVSEASFSSCTILCSLKHLTDQILLPTYSNGSLQSRTITPRTSLRVKASARHLRQVIIQHAYLMSYKIAQRTMVLLSRRDKLIFLII